MSEGVEHRAAHALSGVPKWLWDGQSLPVPVEDIVDSCFGLLVCDVEDLAAAPGAPVLEPGQTLSGLLLEDRGEIWVNSAEARDWPPRRRFTISHELGHWVLHCTETRTTFCRSATVDVPEEAAVERPPLPVPEQEANAFAAALLMPAPLLKAHYQRTGGDFHELCRLFGASGAAMGRRLHAVIR